MSIAPRQLATGGAIYTYFTTRDDLVPALYDELSTSLADTLERARDRAPATGPEAQLVSWGLAPREWALTNPEGLSPQLRRSDTRLLTAPGGPAEQAARRAQSLGGRGMPEPSRARGRHGLIPLSPCYAAKVQAEAPETSPAVAALVPRVWGCIHGLIHSLVMLEVYGHPRSVSNDPATLQRADFLDLVASPREPRFGVSEPVPRG